MLVIRLSADGPARSSISQQYYRDVVWGAGLLSRRHEPVRHAFHSVLGVENRANLLIVDGAVETVAAQQDGISVLQMLFVKMGFDALLRPGSLRQNVTHRMRGSLSRRQHSLLHKTGHQRVVY